jgi:hypothetical protein
LGGRLEGSPLARPRQWPSFETPTFGRLLRTRLMDDIDMILHFENTLLGLRIVESRDCGRLQTDEAVGSIT